MQSLRTKRSTTPSRKNTRSGNGPNKLAKPGVGPTPRPRDPNGRKSRVDDKIKKRMSMRYADISGPTELNGIPAMPPLPGGAEGMGELPSGRRMRGMSGTRDQEEVVRDGYTEVPEGEKAVADDKKLLDQDKFDPDAFLKLKLANSTEAEIKSLQSSLLGIMDDTSSELQHNVFKNYAEFVLISKEISSLENEMIELKDSISEFKSMPSLLHIPDPTSTSSTTVSIYKRSSVADLRIMYFNQMQELHAEVEGSAKFAPTIPGRHVVGDIDGVLSMNAATYKAMGKVKFIILDDCVLVARRRRRVTAGGEGRGNKGNNNEGKLVAERCWPLNEMLVLDTKDSAGMSNVFKIRHGKETHVYRTESSGDKRALLAQFRSVAEDLSAKKRKEREGEHERRKSMWHGGGDGQRNSLVPPLPTDFLNDMAMRMGDLGLDDAKQKAEKELRWTNDWADELTVAIALKEWAKAVSLVEKGNAKLFITPSIASKLHPLTQQLTSALLASLSQQTNRKSTAVQLILLLVQLKAGPAARSTFLTMRTEVIKSNARRIRFEGHIGSYVHDLAMVYFTGIKHTADWFLASFKENEVSSAFIDWSKHRMEDYAEIFRRQVYVSDVEREVVEEALRITFTQSRKLLAEYGLDFHFLLERLLVEQPKEKAQDQATFSFQAHRISKSPEITRHRSPAPRSTPAVTPPEPSPTVPSTVPTLPPITTNLRSSLAPSASQISPANSFSSSVTSNSYSSPPLPPPTQPLQPHIRPVRSRAPLAGSSSSRPPSNPATPPSLSVPLPSSSPSLRSRTPPPPLPNNTMPPTPSSFKEKDRVALPPLTPRRSGGPAPPPRSAHRPGSASRGAIPPVAVPQREGMI